MAHSLPMAVILAWVTKAIVPDPGIVPLLRISFFTVVFGVLIGARWFMPVFRTLQKVDVTHSTSGVRVAAFLTCILFGIGFGTTINVGTHPDASTLDFLYQQHINFVLNVLSEFQAILGLSLPVIQPFISHTVSIYKNNAALALKAAGFGAVGGFTFGVGIPLVLVMGMNAALIWGVFTGILIRNSIAIGNGLFAPPIAYLSSMGLLVVGHTFHEFMAILVAGVGAGFVTLGVVTSKFDTSVAGGKVAVAGFVQLGVAAFLEVWVDPQFIGFLKGFITIEPRVVQLFVGGDWVVGLASVLVTTSILVIVTAWMIRVTTRALEGLL
jgi:hypothetical protein